MPVDEVVDVTKRVDLQPWLIKDYLRKSDYRISLRGL
jgi:hypothetical protein